MKLKLFLYVFLMFLVYFLLHLAKNVEERNIPWSQQVDEAASYENLASPINEDNSAGKIHIYIYYICGIYI